MICAIGICASSAQLAKVHASRLASDLGRLAAGRDTILAEPRTDDEIGRAHV